MLLVVSSCDWRGFLTLLIVADSRSLARYPTSSRNIICHARSTLIQFEESILIDLGISKLFDQSDVTNVTNVDGHSKRLL